MKKKKNVKVVTKKNVSNALSSGSSDRAAMFSPFHGFQRFSAFKAEKTEVNFNLNSKLTLLRLISFPGLKIFGT